MESIFPNAHNDTLPADRYPGFSSCKTRRPIHYRHRWIRDALIQSSLDDSVIEIAPTITPVSEFPRPIEFSFRQFIASGMTLVLLSQVPTTLGTVIDDSRIIVIERSQLVTGPRAIACRAIWAQKRMPVDTADRYRAIERILRCGEPVPMNELVPLLRNPSLDPVHQLFAFLANGFLTADLRAGISPGTLLDLGPATLVS
jgi:hypothetical protein